MTPGDKRPLCEICGKEAIGIQSLGCCASVVCADHADPTLRDAAPGETIVGECCTFLRFDTSADG
ncbi:MAG: hypothetical protein GXY82_02875 [Methanospirillum sp.]|nr:hypothetical protein [Methanospirillum sp.]